MKNTSFGEMLSPILEEIEMTIWEREEALADEPHKFNDNGLRAACKIFMSVVFDKMWQLQENEDMKMEDRLKMTEYLADKIKKLTKEMTGVEISELYKDFN